MTTDPERPSSTPENGPETPSEPPKQRFNPFLHEDDMFKIVLYVGAGVLAIAVLAVLAQAIF